MIINQDIFLNKKILIYGLGKSGIATYYFLNQKSDVFLYDDFKFNTKNPKLKKKIINHKNVLTSKFDKIILSPGIDINKCKLSKFLKKNYSKVYTDLDVFYSFYKNKCITVTGTNGKSTTCQLMYEILLNHKFDSKLVGNIGNPILSVKKVKKKTFFVVEASSYQLEYSKIFKTKYAVILNLSPDHIERHRTFKNYVKAKFKLLKNQSRSDSAFINKNDVFIQRELKTNKFRCRIIKVDNRITDSFLKKINNNYFLTEANKENLSFVLEISKKLNLKKNLLLKTFKNFKGLNYRQQIIFKNKYLTIINDSKSTSFSSSIGVLKTNENVYWLLGGIHKKGDKFNLSKKYCKNIKAFIYGKNKKFFEKKFKYKIKFEKFYNIKEALKKIIVKVKKENPLEQKTILFSPSAASFDSFKNFEDRGNYFNKLINEYKNGL